MVEDCEEDEQPSHSQYATCPVELQLEVEDGAIPYYSHEGSSSHTRSSVTSVLSLCRRIG